MAETFATEVAGIDSKPTVAASGGLQGARLRRFRATIEYDGQASGDTIVLADVPAGYAFAYGVLTASATAGASATVAIGISGTAGKYRAAATFTTANVPTPFGLAAAVKGAALTAKERVIATVGTAALPTSADYLIVDLYFSAP